MVVLMRRGSAQDQQFIANTQLTKNSLSKIVSVLDTPGVEKNCCASSLDQGSEKRLYNVRVFSTVREKDSIRRHGN
jgi:hypothetical protein